VYVVGGENLPDQPALIVAAGGRSQFATLEPELGAETELLDIFQPARAASAADLRKQLDDGQARLRDGQCQAVLYFPADFGQRLEQFRRRLTDGKGGVADVDLPTLESFHNT